MKFKKVMSLMTAGIMALSMISCGSVENEKKLQILQVKKR